MTEQQRERLLQVKAGRVTRIGAGDSSRHVLSTPEGPVSAGAFMTWLRLDNLGIIEYRPLGGRQFAVVLTEKGERELSSHGCT